MPCLSELLASPGDTVGTWSQLSTPAVLEMLGRAGFAFTVIDCEHAAFGLETAEAMVRTCEAAGLAALLRVPSNDRAWIGRALDAGATGVVVPGIESAAEVAAAVRATRFAPRGTRGACPCVRSAGHSTPDWRGYAHAQDAVNGIVALVETPAGVEAIDEICAVDGLRAVMAGPFDLSVSMGLDGDLRHPDVRAALERVVAAARRARLPLMMPVFSADPEEARRLVDHWRGEGVRIFLLGTDKILVQEQFRRYVAALA